MNLSVFASSGDVFTNCECIKGYAFRMVAPRGKSAHLTAAIALLQDKSVYPTVCDASRHINAS